MLGLGHGWALATDALCFPVCYRTGGPAPAESCSPPLCTTCAANGRTCTACSEGYGRGTGDACARCKIDNCNSCSTDAYKCWGCSAGYRLEGGSCVRWGGVMPAAMHVYTAMA